MKGKDEYIQEGNGIRGDQPPQKADHKQGSIQLAAFRTPLD